MTDTDTLTREDVQLHTGLDNADLAHIVDQRKYNLTEAYILGTTVIALCGYEWIPTKDPHKLPVCPACVATLSSLGGNDSVSL